MARSASLTFGLIAFIGITALGGCAGLVSSSSSPPGSPVGGGTVAAFISDAPATGIVFFRVKVTGATLSDASGNSVSILNTMPQPELRHLELAPTLLVQSSLNSGNYSKLSVTLANPELSIATSQGGVSQVSGTTTPTVSLSVSSVDIPVSLGVQPGAIVGVMLDVDLAKSISTDPNGNYVVGPVINASIVNSAKPTLVLVDTTGTVMSVASSNETFSVKLNSTGNNITVMANSGTLWSSDIGQLSNLQNGQIIELNAEMQSGSYVASYVGSAVPSSSTVYEGVVTQVAPDKSSFTVAIQE